MRKHGQAGFTLLEAAVASIVLGTIVAITMSILVYSQEYTRTESALTHFHYKSRKCAEEAMTPLLGAKIEFAYVLNSDGSIATTYKVSTATFPIQGGIECIEFKQIDKNNPMDSDGKAQWSANSFYLRFISLVDLHQGEPGKQIPLVSEAVGPGWVNVGKDLNLDGDTNDTYIPGILQIAQGPENSPPLNNSSLWQSLWQNDDSMVLLFPSSPSGDIFPVDGDASEQIAKSVDIRLIFFDRVNNVSMPIFDNIALRNFQ